MLCTTPFCVTPPSPSLSNPMRRRLLLSVTVPLRTRTLISPPLLSSPSHHLLSRSNKHSASPHDDPHDPPFSPIAKAPNPKPKQSPKARNPKPKQAPKALPSGMDKSSLPLHSDLPFDFRYSYSETDPSLRPIGYREPPRFSPFGPGRLDRKWDGLSAPATGEAAEDRVSDDRNSVLGDPLTEEEVDELVERYRHSDCSRQINLGWLLLLPISSFNFSFCLGLSIIISALVLSTVAVRIWPSYLMPETRFITCQSCFPDSKSCSRLIYIVCKQVLSYPHFDHFTITCFSLYFGSSVLHKFLALCKYVFPLYIDTIKQHYASPGTGGVTHNTLEDIHNHWKRAEAVRIKCLGVPTLDMDNLCFHLEVEMQFCIPHQKFYMLLRHNNFHN